MLLLAVGVGLVASWLWRRWGVGISLEQVIYGSTVAGLVLEAAGWLSSANHNQTLFSMIGLIKVALVTACFANLLRAARPRGEFSAFRKPLNFTR